MVIKNLFKHYKVGKIMVVWGVMVEVGGRGDCLINKDGKPPKKNCVFRILYKNPH